MGYQLVDFKCVDVDECQWTTCGRDSVCINSLGSFRCECALDFAGSGLNCSKSLDVCGQKFDLRYEENCNNTEPPWQLRYYYNYETKVCQQFRYGGCQFAGEQNIFRDLQACQNLCGGFRLPNETKRVTSPTYDYARTTEVTVPGNFNRISFVKVGTKLLFKIFFIKNTNTHFQHYVMIHSISQKEMFVLMERGGHAIILTKPLIVALSFGTTNHAIECHIILALEIFLCI